jgi:antitoxin HigA-1
LACLDLSQAELARRTGFPTSRITEIIKGRRTITTETALAMAAFFGNSAQFLLNLQTSCDLPRVEIEKADNIRAQVKPLSAA